MLPKKKKHTHTQIYEVLQFLGIKSKRVKESLK